MAKQQTKKKPLEVSDPKRVKSYTDSLSKYNTSKTLVKNAIKSYGRTDPSLEKNMTIKIDNAADKKKYTGTNKPVALFVDFDNKSGTIKNRIPVYKKPTTPVVMKKTPIKESNTKKPIPKMASKPTVKADTVKTPISVPKKPTMKPDSIGVGFGDRVSKISANDLKGMVKKYNLKSVDTSSVRKMKETSYGSRDLADMADRYKAGKGKNK